MFFHRIIKRRNKFEAVLIVLSVGYILCWLLLGPRINHVRLATIRAQHSSSARLLHSRVAQRLVEAYNALLGGEKTQAVNVLQQSRDLLDDIASMHISHNRSITLSRPTRIHIVAVLKRDECGDIVTNSEYLLTVSAVDISWNDESQSIVWRRCQTGQVERRVVLSRECDSECLLNRQLLEGSAADEDTGDLLLLAHQLVSFSTKQLQQLIQPFHLLKNQRVAAVVGSTISAYQRKLHCWQSRYTAWKLSMRTSPLSARSAFGCADCSQWLFCDDVGGPMLINSTVWKQVPIPSLPDKADMFTTLRSHFLALKNSGFQSIAIPDSDLEVKSPEYEPKKLMQVSVWNQLVKSWRLSGLWFNGRRVAIDYCWCPGSARSTVYHFSFPECCGLMSSAFLQQLFVKGRQNSLPVELAAGSVLAAVKLARQLPWDFDIDLLHSYDNLSEWQRILNRGILQKATYTHLLHSKGITWYSYFCHRHSSSGIDVDFGGGHVLFSVPPHVSTSGQKAKATLVQLGPGIWLEAPANPGLYTRQTYGPGCLRHLAHWRALGSNGTHWEERSSSVTWPQCPMPSHPACLSSSDIDGSLIA